MVKSNLSQETQTSYVPFGLIEAVFVRSMVNAAKSKFKKKTICLKINFPRQEMLENLNLTNFVKEKGNCELKTHCVSQKLKHFMKVFMKVNSSNGLECSC